MNAAVFGSDREFRTHCTYARLSRCGETPSAAPSLPPGVLDSWRPPLRCWWSTEPSQPHNHFWRRLHNRTPLDGSRFGVGGCWRRPCWRRPSPPPGVLDSWRPPLRCWWLLIENPQPHNLSWRRLHCTMARLSRCSGTTAAAPSPPPSVLDSWTPLRCWWSTEPSSAPQPFLEEIARSHDGSRFGVGGCWRCPWRRLPASSTPGGAASVLLIENPQPHNSAPQLS